MAAEEMDKCVICKQDTIYPKNMHIDFREYYIEGAGQLCKNCHDKIYNINDVRKDISSD